MSFILLLAAGGYFTISGLLKVEPAPLLEEVMKKAYQAKSYRYKLEADLDIGGKKKNGSRCRESVLVIVIT